MYEMKTVYLTFFVPTHCVCQFCSIIRKINWFASVEKIRIQLFVGLGDHTSNNVLMCFTFFLEN